MSLRECLLAQGLKKVAVICASVFWYALAKRRFAGFGSAFGLTHQLTYAKVASFLLQLCAA